MNHVEQATTAHQLKCWQSGWIAQPVVSKDIRPLNVSVFCDDKYLFNNNDQWSFFYCKTTELTSLLIQKELKNLVFVCKVVGVSVTLLTILPLRF
jgi:hypothetical protein